MLGAAFDLPVDAGERRTTRTHEAALNLRLAQYDLSDAVFTLRSQLASALTTLQATQRLSAFCAEGQTLRFRTLDQA
jgi:outer membrane protein TolC